MNWLMRKYRIWKIKKNTTQGMMGMAYLKHIGRIAFIGGSVGYINGTINRFPNHNPRILIIIILSAISGYFIAQTVRYLKASFKREIR